MTTLEKVQETKRTSEEDLARTAKRKDRVTTWGWRIAGYVFFLGIWEEHDVDALLADADRLGAGA